MNHAPLSRRTLLVSALLLLLADAQAANALPQIEVWKSPSCGCCKDWALGLAVPGMPVGSPGMDGPAYAGRKDPYAVLLVQRNGTSTVFKPYPG